jgi:hypothetical protein
MERTAFPSGAEKDAPSAPTERGESRPDSDGSIIQRLTVYDLGREFDP